MGTKQSKEETEEPGIDTEDQTETTILDELVWDDGEPVEKNVAKVIELYNEGKELFQKWEANRKENIGNLRAIADEIQHIEFADRVGQITYSSVGIVGAGLTIAGIALLPFTFGASLGLTVAGAATGITSGVASLTHTGVNIGLTKKKSNTAKDLLEDDAEKTENLRNLTGELKMEFEKIKAKLSGGKGDDLEGNPMGIGNTDVDDRDEIINAIVKLSTKVVAPGVDIVRLLTSSKALVILRATENIDDVADIIGLGVVGGRMVPSFMKENVKGVTRISSKVVIPLVAVSVLIDIGTIARNAYSLDKKLLCDAAQKLVDAADKMEAELEAYSKCFSGTERDEETEETEEE